MLCPNQRRLLWHVRHHYRCQTRLHPLSIPVPNCDGCCHEEVNEQPTLRYQLVPRKANWFRLCWWHRHVIWLTCHHATHDRWFNTNAAKVGLRIGCEKKKTTFVGEPPTTPISVGSNLLQSVENFQYLGSYISNQSDIEDDIRARLGKAALVFHRLNRIWSNYSINSRLPSNFVSTHQSCYPQHCMYAKRGSQRRVSATPWMCSTVDVSERSWDCRGKIVSLTRSWWEDRGCKPYPR